MFEAEQFQQRLQIREVELAFDLVGRTWSDVAIGNQFERGVGFHQVLIEVGFLLGKGEAEPLGKNLVMTVTKGAVCDFAAHDLTEGRMRIEAGQSIA